VKLLGVNIKIDIVKLDQLVIIIILLLIKHETNLISLLILEGPSWSWLHGGWIYNHPCNQWLSPLKLW